MKFILAFLGSAILFLGIARGETEAMVAQNLAPTGFGSAKQPQIAVSPKGDIYVVFAKDDSIYLTTSTDHGQSFSGPAKVAQVPGLMVGMRRGPRIAVAANRILITAPGKDLASFLSEDNGATWSQTPAVNDLPGSADEGLQNITALPDGSFYAVWLDFRAGSKQVEGARMDAEATTWGGNVTVYRSPEKSVCPCCHPSVASDGNGKLVVMWRNSLEANRDFYLAESTDRGDSFSPARKLGTGSWKLNACPMDGGNLIATPDAGVFTVWRRMNEVFLDQPGEFETKIAEGTQPVLARIMDQIYCVWEQQGNLVVARDSGRTRLGTFSGVYASLAASPDGKEGYLVWENITGNDVVPQFVILR